MWVRRRERPAPARLPVPGQVLRQEPLPEQRKNLRAQALVFAHQR